jgi:hypothetical protein
MINYQLTKEYPNSEPNGVIKTNDGVFVMWIPFNPDNTDYAAYLKWLEAGNTPQPADEVTK